MIKLIALSLRNLFSQFGYKHLICGIGDSEILNDIISFKNYPFKPSFVSKKRKINANEIICIYLNSSPPTIGVENDLIFISKEYEKELEEFARRNKIPIRERNTNWSYITEPYLDTEFTEEQQRRSIELLSRRGITPGELNELRRQIAQPMLKYNSFLWEWINLGLSDVLSAMRKKLNSKEFEKFYWYAIEIDRRKEN